jgi:choline dehydrogenase-like flavoprotein
MPEPDGDIRLIGGAMESAQFDYVIVGAGSAGSVLAERLSASGRHRVLVLEAGGSDRRFYVALPLGYGKLFYDPAVNWMYRAEPDPGLAGARDHWPRGKILGGSSSINAMVWIRGHRSDYDDWGALAGPGWGAAAVQAACRPSTPAVKLSMAGTRRKAVRPISRPRVGARLGSSRPTRSPSWVRLATRRPSISTIFCRSR